MARRQATNDETIEEAEPEERREQHNSAARAEIIRDTCATIAELDRQIDGIKAEKKAVIETQIVADLNMKKADFALAYKLYQMDGGARETLLETVRECFAALLPGQQLDWVAAAEAAQ